MPDRRRTRERQLAKLAERRAAERRKKRRQRLTAAGVAIAAAVGGLVFAFIALTGGGSPKPLAGPTPTPTVTQAASTVACGGAVPTANAVKKKVYKKAPKMTIDTSMKYLLTMEPSWGTITIELDPKLAPNTVNSLVFLTKKRFFDGTLFHRTVQDFVIQGGDPNTAGGGDPSTFGTGNPGYKTVDAPPKGATYPAGTVAMAKGTTEPNGTAGSEFFIVTGQNADQALAPGGKGQYAIVGKIITGLDVANRIEKLPRQQGAADGRPAQDVYIVKCTVK